MILAKMLELLIDAAAGSLCLALLVGTTLALLRVRNPYLQRIAWCTVLGVALALPFVMWLVRMRPMALPSAASDSVVKLAAAVAQRGQGGVMLYVYWSIGGVLLLRHGWALLQAFRLRRRAQPLGTVQPRGLEVRVSTQLGAPVSIGDCIVLPEHHGHWSQAELQAVVAHELSHIQRGDFLMMNLAQLHRALFWFNPLAWWLPRRLSLLNEHLSDDAALAAFADRSDYARLLLDFTVQQQPRALTMAMARPATVTQRVERILSEDCIAARPGMKARAVLLAGILTPALFIIAQAQGVAAELNREPKSNPLAPLEQPDYPDDSRLASEEGTVVLRIYVLEDGRVADVELKQSSGYPKLDASAAQRALTWRLQPALSNGKPVGAWGEFAVSFRLMD
jgi:TonB family protein